MGAYGANYSANYSALLGSSPPPTTTGPGQTVPLGNIPASDNVNLGNIPASDKIILGEIKG